MGLLTGKTGLVVGVANDRSIAWGIARALHAEGADLGFTYPVPAIEERVRPLAASLGSRFVEPCDVTRDGDIDALFAKVLEVFGHLDILVHAVAFANKEDLKEPYVSTSREGFRVALDVSAYSLVALARGAAPLMAGRNGSIVTMTYYGAEKVMPGYNVMGVAKAALEASVKYLAHDLGPRGIRVNAISAGPIRTLAAAGISGFKLMLHHAEEKAPLKRNVSTEEVGKTALFLASDLASGVTGEIVYVDAGFNVMGA